MKEWISKFKGKVRHAYKLFLHGNYKNEGQTSLRGPSISIKFWREKARG